MTTKYTQLSTTPDRSQPLPFTAVIYSANFTVELGKINLWDTGGLIATVPNTGLVDGDAFGLSPAAGGNYAAKLTINFNGNGRMTDTLSFVNTQALNSSTPTLLIFRWVSYLNAWIADSSAMSELKQEPFQILTTRLNNGEAMLQPLVVGDRAVPGRHGGLFDTFVSIPLDYGTYTPALVAGSNFDSVTFFECAWLRVGSTVTVSGRIDVDATAAGPTLINITLPVASNFTTVDQCGGVGAPVTVGEVIGIMASDVLNTARFIWNAVYLSVHEIRFTFTYQIL